jgi:endonuclease/exonuclease/phosphatase family metal-dependent hydrolase
LNTDCQSGAVDDRGDVNPARPCRRKWWIIGSGLLIAGLIPLFLFVLNGTVLDRGNVPEVVLTRHAAAAPPKRGDQVRILAYNIAKAFVHRGGFRFAEQTEVQARLDRIAEVVRDAKPDLVFLSEAVRDCGPCPVNQVDYLAERCGMHAWAFGENYNVGLPVYRISGGNAILSRWSLEGIANLDLPGRKPFYVTRNNRRFLICSTEIAGQAVLLGAMHTDSFDRENNAAQSRLIVEALSLQPAVCAGDFNAEPGSESLTLFRDSGRFVGEWNGAATYPSEAPQRTIDYVFGPADWKLVEHRVIRNDASDHYAILTVFEVP